MSETYDLVVIGSGPGGYVCAIRGAQLGLKTALIEKDSTLGGTCLNIGCIPSKALLHSSHLFAEMKEGAEQGIVAKDLAVDLASMMKRKDAVVSQLNGGVKTLVEKRGIEVIKGKAAFESAQSVTVTSGSKTTTVQSKNFVIATGSVPVELPFLPFDGDTVISSTEALELSEIPGKMVVIGGGAIGLEMGSVWSRLGTEVTVLEFLPTIAAGSDDDVSRLAERIFKKQGMKIETRTKVTGVQKRKDGTLLLEAEKKGKEVTFEADKVLVSVGRKPYTVGLALEKAGLETDAKGIIPTDHLKTKVDGIWAIGDVTTGPMLAHKAEEGGVAVAEQIADKSAHLDYNLVPNVIYTHPEIASVGITEREAKEQGIEYKTGKFNLQANGRAIAQMATDGFVKIIADAKTDQILGAAVIAASASEMIASIVAHMTYCGSAEDLGKTIHAHPTISESIKEAALAVSGDAIHSL